ncbi:MAG TPA: RNA 2',3'-cyclic phosphodiesterase [Steroidobacteraceae bacterium]|nr:RNA 2',3'-cyclic phosphodiesterase [Steroidobacteraceae bacterium]
MDEVELGRRPKSRRVFFALWPDEATRKTLEAATREVAETCGGRPVPSNNFHVTLLFVGAVTEERIGDLQLLAQRVAATLPWAADCADTPLLLFDRIEHWLEPQVLCATCGPGPESSGVAFAGELARRLREGLSGAGFTLEQTGLKDQIGFRPHVTLARKVSRWCEREMAAVPWGFKDFSLVDSRPGPQGSLYRVLATFPLSWAAGR